MANRVVSFSAFKMVWVESNTHLLMCAIFTLKRGLIPSI